MSADLAVRILEIALSNAVLATVLALAAWAARRWTRRPALVHGLCLLALLKLLTPPLFALPILPAATAPAVSAPIDAELLAAAMALEPVAAAPALSWQGVVVLVLLAGTLSVFGLWWVRGRRFRRLLSLAQPAPAALCVRAGDLAARVGLRRAPPLRIVAGRLSPMLCPLRGQPYLLLPAALLDRLSDVERDSVLLHELAHVQRRDHWVRRVEALVVALYWWLPLVWWLRRNLREAEEQCCDAWVVWALPGSARAYAGALLSTVDFLAEPVVAAPVGACGVGPVHDLKKRLVMIMEQSTPRGLGNRGLTVLALAACLLPALPTRAQDPDERRAVSEAKRELDELRQEMDRLRATIGELRRRQEPARRDRDERDQDATQERLDEAAERLHEHLREHLGPEVEGQIREAMKQVHEHLEHVDGDVREHVREALEQARAQIHEHLGPETKEQIHAAMQQVQEHLRHLDGEVGEQVRQALDQARVQLHEHLGPQVQKEIAEAMKQVHEHLGQVDGEVRRQVEDALRAAKAGLAEGRQALREAADERDPEARRVQARTERSRAAQDRARVRQRADANEEAGDVDADERRVLDRVRTRLRQRTDASDETLELRAQIERLEADLAAMRAKLRATERRKR